MTRDFPSRDQESSSDAYRGTNTGNGMAPAPMGPPSHHYHPYGSPVSGYDGGQHVQHTGQHSGQHFASGSPLTGMDTSGRSPGQRPYSSVVSSQTLSFPRTAAHPRSPPNTGRSSQGVAANTGQSASQTSPQYRSGYEREDPAGYPVGVRSSSSESKGRVPPPPPGTYPAPPVHYPPSTDERRWGSHEKTPQVGAPPQPRYGYDGQPYGPGNATNNKSRPAQGFQPSNVSSHVPPHYPYNRTYNTPPSNRIDGTINAHLRGHPKSDGYKNVDGREGATSPSQIENTHKTDVTNMGCTCKKTQCLKLYCQCFAVQIYCGTNCRCLGCFNNPQHEKERKDAKRIILSRNPSAFETKFSKTNPRVSKDTQVAHKLGCKCRKSACLKKYCECYAGNVKCSANCRCVGCKNMPPGGFGPPGAGSEALYTNRQDVMLDYDATPATNTFYRNAGETREMSAAQNLTSLKHSSPVTHKPTGVYDTGDGASMPSLAASSSDTSPDEQVDVPYSGRTETTSTESSRGDVNVLLIAAAMAEIRSQEKERSMPPISTSSKPPVLADYGTPPRYGQPSSFRSPKRKSTEAAVGSTDNLPPIYSNAYDHANNFSTPSGKKSSPQMTTPSDPRESKRTRLGSVSKQMSWDRPSDGLMKIKRATDIIESPNTANPGAEKLTPVSERCRDLRRMHVDEKSSTIHPSS